MAEESPLLHVDNDWKKQAQEEKRKLAEAAAAKAAAPAVPAVPPSGTSVAAQPARTGRRPGETPSANFPSLVQSILTQALYYLGDLASATGQQRVDIDMARYQLDLMGMLEDKTKNNLTPDETNLLDAALYEGRTRFVNVASQLLGP